MNNNMNNIEKLWEEIASLVDNMVKEVSEDELDLPTVTINNKNDNKKHTKVKLIDPESAREVAMLEAKTLELLEDIISLMYFGGDVISAEAKSDSAFLAKLSTRLHRKVLLGLEAPMAVGMFKNDRNVYLLVNPIRLRFTVKSVGEIVAIVRHELYHILYRHLAEAKQYGQDEVTQYILNVAQDCEINQEILIRDKLPEGCITLDYVREESCNQTLEEKAGYLEYFTALMTSEEYKKKIQQEQGNKQELVFNRSEDGEGLDGSTVDLDELVGNGSHNTWKNEDVSQDTAEKVIEGMIKDTYNGLTDKERGMLSQSILDTIDKITHAPEIDWKDQIKRQHGRMKSKNKRKTLARPNRRFPNRLDLKGKLPNYTINLVMAVDVSGSVSNNALAYTMGEGYHLSKELDAPFTLLQIDWELVSEQKVERPTDLDKVDINGRGGTRFQPAFDYLRKQNLTDANTMLVYVTDGYGESEQDLQRHGFNNVLWVLVDTDNKSALSCDGKGRVELLNNDKSYG